MPTEHHVMAAFADALRAWGLGAHVWELDGWKVNRQGYYWTDPDDTHDGYNGQPSHHLNHHTATAGYTPYVVNSSGQTKANVYTGLRRGNRLYQFDGGVPTLAIASAGPANYSAGKNNREFMDDFASKDVRFPGPQHKLDTPGFYGNRYSWNTEHVALGDGSALAQDMWDLIVEYNACLSDFLSWSAWRNGGHYDGTKRKIDLYVEQGGPYSVGLLQDQVNDRLTGTVPPPILPPIDPPIEPPEVPVYDQIGRDILYVKEGQQGLDVEYWQVRIIEAITGVKSEGNSNLNFIRQQAPNLTPKVWNATMTAYFSAWTGRNSYGVGPTEKKLVENAVWKLYQT